MLPLISVVLVILGALGIKRLLPRNRKRRRQVRFIRETLAANRKFDNRRVIASLSTVPLDWDDAKMTRASELREPRLVAVITGCGSYLIQPRFFDESLWDYSAAPQVAFISTTFGLVDVSVVVA
jgi:hypothetical protein